MSDFFKVIYCHVFSHILKGKKKVLFVTVMPMPFAIYRAYKQIPECPMREPMGVHAPSCIDCH